MRHEIRRERRRGRDSIQSLKDQNAALEIEIQSLKDQNVALEMEIQRLQRERVDILRDRSLSESTTQREIEKLNQTIVSQQAHIEQMDRDHTRYVVIL